MLQDADVLKIKCKFVIEFIKFLKRRKYSVSACHKSTLVYFSDAYLATVLYDCLTPDDICYLQNKASKYNDNTVDIVETLTCAEQVTTDITTMSEPCSVSFSVQNTGDGSAFPYISSLTNDAVNQDASVNITMQDCDGSETVRIGQWCNGDPLVCTGDGVKAYTGFSVSNIYSASPNAAIEYLKLSYVHNNIVTNELLYVHPSNVATFTGCIGCESITGSDLYLPTSSAGNAVYKTA